VDVALLYIGYKWVTVKDGVKVEFNDITPAMLKNDR